VELVFTEVTADTPPLAAQRATAPWARLGRSIEYRLKRILYTDLDLSLAANFACWQPRFTSLSAAQAAEIFDADLVFAHEIWLAERLVQLMPAQSKRKLILMSHSPTFPICEFVVDSMPHIDLAALRRLKLVRGWIARYVNVMGSARAVAWPSAGAEEGYPEWLSLRRKTGAASVYIPTGAPRPVPATSPETMRQRWGVQRTQRAVLYMGRPHTDKGYELFVQWSTAPQLNRADWIFIHAGAPPKVPAPAVRYVGYESDNAGAYGAADLVVFPNRFAYMDIGLLECMSIGAALASTLVGGHGDILRAYPFIPRIDDDVRSLVSAFDAYARDPELPGRIQEAWAAAYSPAAFLAAHVAAARRLTSTAPQ
jgi:glycosyltransferase involved in cell wall biosynthesis